MNRPYTDKEKEYVRENYYKLGVSNIAINLGRTPRAIESMASKYELCGKREKHGMSHRLHKDRFYNIWCGMKARCYDSGNKCYDIYGGRGIVVCDDWKDNFINFKRDMLNSYIAHYMVFGKKNTTIDRIDTNGNYEKSNCRWATLLTQADNTRKNKKFKATSPTGVVFLGHNASQFSREHNLNFSHVCGCCRGERKSHKGWTFEYVEDNK